MTASQRNKGLVVGYVGDTVGRSVIQHLVSSYGFTNVNEQLASKHCVSMYRKDDMYALLVDRECMYSQQADITVDATHVIFASRHVSLAGTATLTVHATGNCTNETGYGGNPKSLSIADCLRMQVALQYLANSCQKLGLPYEVTLEATHHGPTELDLPSFFIEIGSSEKEWNDGKAAMIIANAIWNTCSKRAEGQTAVGFGGGHYPMKHTREAIEGRYALGHVLSKYFFDQFDEGIVEAAFRRSHPSCDFAIIDWKGIKRATVRRRLVALLENHGVKIIKV